MSPRKRFPWGPFWGWIAVAASIVLVVGFVLKHLRLF
jgi:hypothetical protein